MSPGFNTTRLVNLMRSAVARCRLDLRGATVLTEAATGAYVVTPVLAAMARADRVFARVRPTRHGTVAQATAGTMDLAAAAGCADRVKVIGELTPEIIGASDIITNSGHVRPIDARFIARMKPSAVIPLMYESWEFREADLDLQACRDRGVRVAGTNERHPAVDVFSYLGTMAVKLLLDAGVCVYGSRVLVLCDNPFAPFIERGLAAAGARVEMAEALPAAARSRDAASKRGDGANVAGVDGMDAVLVALRPRTGPVIGTAEAEAIHARWPGAVLAQYWGDVDRASLAAAGVPVWPESEPAAGHMAILPSGVGPEPIVRLQSAGLKVGEVLLRCARTGDRTDWDFVDEL